MMADRFPREEVILQRHPAERRPPPGVVLPQFACCCCCCCCLHSVGGLIGAIIGSAGTIPQEPKPVDPDFPFPFRRDELENEPDLIPATAVYWLLVLFLMSCLPLGMILTQTRPREIVETSAFTVILLFPLFQLGASVLGVFGVLIFYTDRVNALRRLGRITLYSFVGTLIGTAIMAGFCSLFLLR